MKFLKLSLLISAVLMGGILWAKMPADKSNEKGIHFEQISFNQALAQAKKEHKLIFLNVYATWCHPCKMLMKNTLTSDKVGILFNKKFVNLSIDAEKGEGIELAKRYQVRAHPLMLIINPEGKVVKRILGYREPAELLEEVKGLTR